MTLQTRLAPSSWFLVASALLIGGAGAGCYGSELGGTAPDVPTTPDATDASSETGDGTAPGDVEVTETSVPDGETTDTPDTIVVPPEWETLGLGDAGPIGDVVVLGKELAYAVSGARVLRWNGATWLAYGEPGGARALNGVWADADEVVVVGAGGLVARRKAGGPWQTVDAGTTRDLWDVDGRAADDLLVVGDAATILRWDGATWTEKFTKDTIDLRSVWVDPKSSGDAGVLAVGTGGQLVSYDTTASAFKAAQIAGNAVTLWDVLTDDAGTMIAVGTGHTITARRTVDVTWRGQATNDASERDVFALAKTHDGKLWAFGARGLVLQQSGTTWGTVQAAQAAAGLKDFATAGVVPGKDGDVFVVAATGGGVRMAGTTWTPFGTRPEAGVKDLAAAPDGTLWAVGTLGLFMSRGDDGWSAHVLPPAIAKVDLESVAVTASGVVYAVGASGTIVKKVDDAAVVKIASPVPLDLFGVTASGSGAIACGRGGTLVTIDGGDDTTAIRASGSVADLRAVMYGGDGALWISGAFGTLLRAPGAGLPAPILSGVGGSLNDLASVEGGVLVAGDNGVVLAADAAGVELLAETAGVFLQAIAVRGDARYAAGWNGTILHQDGEAWSSEVTGTNLILEAIWLGQDEALAAGRQGILLRRLETP